MVGAVETTLDEVVGTLVVTPGNLQQMNFPTTMSLKKRRMWNDMLAPVVKHKIRSHKRQGSTPKTSRDIP
eukprot:scaffold5223_cov138-Cylindrotheca_fusiformis.AAC.1